jgi:hypothetical protein
MDASEPMIHDRALRHAGPGLLETLLLATMTSPAAAADPAGAGLVVELLDHLAMLDAERVERLLVPDPPCGRLELVLTPTGGPPRTSRLVGLTPLHAFYAALERADAGAEDVDLVLIDPSGTERVLLTAAAGQRLVYVYPRDLT